MSLQKVEESSSTRKAGDDANTQKIIMIKIRCTTGTSGLESPRNTLRKTKREMELPKLAKRKSQLNFSILTNEIHSLSILELNWFSSLKEPCRTVFFSSCHWARWQVAFLSYFVSHCGQGSWVYTPCSQYRSGHSSWIGLSGFSTSGGDSTGVRGSTSCGKNCVPYLKQKICTTLSQF